VSSKLLNLLLETSERPCSLHSRESERALAFVRQSRRPGAPFTELPCRPAKSESATQVAKKHGILRASVCRLMKEAQRNAPVPQNASIAQGSACLEKSLRGLRATLKVLGGLSRALSTSGRFLLPSVTVTQVPSLRRSLHGARRSPALGRNLLRISFG